MSTSLSHATRTVHASIGQVWGILAAYGCESLWFPNVTKSTLEGFGVGSTRSLWFDNGPKGGTLGMTSLFANYSSTLMRRFIICAGKSSTITWATSSLSRVSSFAPLMTKRRR
ncbi:hypothetical protein AUP68_12247 [Ilyonectria robusta]